MTSGEQKELHEMFVCSNCHGPLLLDQDYLACKLCSEKFRKNEAGQWDMRLSLPKSAELSFALGVDLPVKNDDDCFSILKKNCNAQVDYGGVQAPHHLSKELISYISKASGSESVALDLGCGDGSHRAVCEKAGFNYIGLDYVGEAADMLGDAHSLPFADDSIEFVMSIAVLEHIRYPFVMMNEVMRVLKPGSTFIGTSAFLEPFHDNSYYHCSHLGVYSALTQAGFRVVHVSPNPKWTVLSAQAKTLFPGVPPILAKTLVMPLRVLHELWWSVLGLLHPKAGKPYRLRRTAGSYSFIAVKE